MVRVTRNLLTNNVLSALQRNLGDLSRIQGQISSGRRYQRVSDNPIDFTQSLSLRQGILSERRYIRNIDMSNTSLNLTETSLGQVTDLLQRARELTLTAANDALPPESRNAVADELVQIFQQVMQTANAAFDRGYLFGGNQTQTSPFVSVGGHVIYRGDMGNRNIEVARDALVATSLHGLQTFIARPNVLRTLEALAISDLDAPLGPQIQALNPNLALTAGDFQINGATIAFDPATQSIKDLRDLINAANVDVIAELRDGRLELTGKRSIDIKATSGSPTTTGNILLALGMFQQIKGSPLVDLGVDPPLTGATNLETLPGFVPPITLQGLRLTLDQQTIDIDLSAVDTVDELAAAVRAQTNGRVEVFINAAGNGLTFAATSTTEQFSVDNLRRAFGNDLGGGQIDIGTQLGTLSGFPFGNLTIINGVDTEVIDLSALGPTDTVGDLIRTIEAAGLNVNVVVNAGGDGLDLVSNDPTQTLTVAVGATALALGWLGVYDQDNATSLRIEKDGGSEGQRSESVLQTLYELEQSIRKGQGADALNRLLGDLDRDMTRLLDSRSVVGARINRLDATRSRSEAFDIFMVTLLSEREDVDLAQALSDLATRENVMVASLNAASRVLQPSLMDFLR